jgi:hypothetical protein
MASFEFLAIVVSILGLAASITYYAIILRNQNETRQTQVFIQIHEQLNSIETHTIFMELMNLEIKDYDEYVQKYDSVVNPEHYARRAHIWYIYSTIGELLRLGVIQPEIIHRLLIGPQVILMWEKWEFVIKQNRINENAPEIWAGFEYLATEMKKFREKKEYPHVKYGF